MYQEVVALKDTAYATCSPALVRTFMFICLILMIINSIKSPMALGLNSLQIEIRPRSATIPLGSDLRHGNNMIGLLRWYSYRNFLGRLLVTVAGSF